VAKKKLETSKRLEKSFYHGGGKKKGTLIESCRRKKRQIFKPNVLRGENTQLEGSPQGGRKGRAKKGGVMIGLHRDA